MNVIAYDNGAGVSIVNPTACPDGQDAAAWLEAVRLRSVPAGASYAVVDASTIPTDRAARAALRLVNGALTTDTAAALATVKAALSKQIDNDAEAVRLRYITPGDGMAMTYQEKFAQAQAVNSMGQSVANAMSQAAREAQFPTLSASVGIEAATLWECAALVLQRYAAFAQLSLGIERARLAAKKAVVSAPDIASARAAHGAIVWPT